MQIGQWNTVEEWNRVIAEMEEAVSDLEQLRGLGPAETDTEIAGRIDRARQMVADAKARRRELFPGN